jgi:hypothetical protein
MAVEHGTASPTAGAATVGESAHAQEQAAVVALEDRGQLRCSMAATGS